MIQTYTMYGKLARVWPFPPNWSSPITETLEWKTDVLKSHNGTEQRRALRTIPRRGFEYSLIAKGAHTELLESLLWGWQSFDFALPVWTDRGQNTADIQIGATLISVVTNGLGFRTADYAIMFESPTNYEFFEVQSVGSNSITSAHGLTKMWPAGSRVYPLILAHLATSAATDRHTSSIIEMRALFNTSPNTAYSHIIESAAPAMYDGIELITHKPNWKSAIQNEFTREFDIVDAGVGPLAYFQRETTSRVVRPFAWFLKSRDAIRDFRSTMGRLRGQAKTCWIPSWHDDFTIAASNSANQSILTVKGTSFFTMVGVDTSRDRLAIRLPSGVTVYRRIMSAIPNYVTDTTAFQLDSVLGTTVGVSDNLRLQLLLRCRLASDKVVIPWQTDSFSAPTTTFTTVKI